MNEVPHRFVEPQRWHEPQRWDGPTRPDEQGSAALEFLTAGLILMLPLVYLVVTLAQVQSASLGSEAIARQAAHVVARTGNAADVAHTLQPTINAVAEQYDLDPDDVAVAVTCLPEGPSCPHAGATVRVTARTLVALPLAPRTLVNLDIGTVPVEATAVHKVSRFWEE